jgi:hypothetical protein
MSWEIGASLGSSPPEVKRKPTFRAHLERGYLPRFRVTILVVVLLVFVVLTLFVVAELVVFVQIVVIVIENEANCKERLRLAGWLAGVSNAVGALGWHAGLSNTAVAFAWSERVFF